MRSPNDLPNSIPNAACSVSNQAAPMPRTARPPERWSSVVIIFTTSAGLRNVFAPTSRPMDGPVVTWLQPAMTT